MFYKANCKEIFAILFLTFFVWHKILNQAFLGEGYYYFDHQLDFFIPTTFQSLAFIRQFDNFARILFDIFPPFFKDNIQAYMLLELCLISILYLSIYFVITKITKSKMIGFFTTAFFLSNYVGSFYLLADGNYQRFVQRVPNFIPSIFSFYFLFKYYNNKYIKYYIISLSLYIFSLLMAHYSSIILPLFIIYPFVRWFQQKKTIRSLVLLTASLLPFILVTFFITKLGDQAPARNIFQFILTEPDIVKRVFYEIPLVTLPVDLIPLVAKNLYNPPIKSPYLSIMPFFASVSLLFYVIGGILVTRRQKDLLVLYITSFLTMIGSMLVYMYVDVRINTLKDYGADRFFFIPSLFAAICWTCFLKASVFKKRFLYGIILTFFLSSFIIYNTYLIWQKMDSIQYKSVMMKSFITLIKTRSNQFRDHTIIIVPSYLQWPSPMISGYSGNPNVTIKLEFDGWENGYWSMKDNVYVFDYEYDKSIDRDVNPNAGHMLDLTKKYRNGEKIKFLN